MLQHYRIASLLAVLALVGGLLGACSPGKPPKVGTIQVEPGTTIQEGETVSLMIQASGNDLQFKWTASRGTLSDPSAPSVLYVAPQSSGPDTVTVEVTSRGGTVVQSITLNIVSLATPTPTDTATPPPPTDTVAPTETFAPTPTGTPTSVAVRLDDLAVPEAWMGGASGDPAAFMSLGLSPAGCYTGSDCLQITYRTGGGWGGIMWWPLGCNWETANQYACGINVLEAGNFGAVERLTFWARGERGGERIEFVVGSNPGGLPPTPRRSLGTVTLGAAWERYEIDLGGIDLTDAIALFYLGASDGNNPDGAVFYLDDIQLEGVR